MFTLLLSLSQQMIRTVPMVLRNSARCIRLILERIDFPMMNIAYAVVRIRDNRVISVVGVSTFIFDLLSVCCIVLYYTTRFSDHRVLVGCRMETGSGYAFY